MLSCDIRVRDPYIVVCDGSYYLYVSDLISRVAVYKSCDLNEWEYIRDVYNIESCGWAEKDVWAPEVHFYNNRYYMLVSHMGKDTKRGTMVLSSASPDGDFLPIADKPITPEGKSCIDATLFIEDQIPYIIYSSDWPFNYDEKRDVYIGEIWAAETDRELKKIKGEPFLLFKSDEAPCSKKPSVHSWDGKRYVRYGSDGPFVQRLSDGSLYLTWSPHPDKIYIVASAVSKSGKIRGEWEHIKEPLYKDNGGHAMFFTDLEGNRKMCIHYPEIIESERLKLVDVSEENGCLKIREEQK